jgi:hypothetical protein
MFVYLKELVPYKKSITSVHKVIKSYQMDID